MRHNGFRDRPIRPLSHPSREILAGAPLLSGSQSGLFRPLLRKEGGQKGCTLRLAYATDHGHLMIEPRDRNTGCTGSRRRRPGGRTAPKTKRPNRAATSAPAHMGHGSSVTTRVAVDKRHPPSAAAASRSASISAWAVGSPECSRSLCRAATTSPLTRTTAPTGTSPCASARPRLPEGECPWRRRRSRTAKRGWIGRR